jgi:hypothetical protein
MTHQEREAETQRLMAILQGEGDPVMITESGELQISADDRPYCHYCFAYLDDGEGRTIEDDDYCDVCFVAVLWLMHQQIVCRDCAGKCQVYAPVTVDAVKSSWQTCPTCTGKGWEPGHIVFDHDSDMGQEMIRKVQHGKLTTFVDESTQKRYVRIRP